MSALFVFEYGPAACAADAGPVTQPAVAEWIHTNADPKVDRIEQEVQRRQQTNPAAAKVLEKDLERARDLLAGRAAAPAADAKAELHVVGMYEPGQWRTNERVEVQATPQPIVLVLCAYDPVRWEIKLDEGAKVERVVVGGYDEPTVTWTDPAQAVPVEMHVAELKDRNYFFAYDKQSEEYANLVQKLKQLTGLEVTTFQGAYHGDGGPHIVGPKSIAWFEQIVESQIDPLWREATALDGARKPGGVTETFQAIHFDTNPAAPRVLPNGRRPPPMPPFPGQLPAMLADFTKDGPIIGTFKPLPKGVRKIAAAPNGKSAYALGMHDVMQIDLTTGASMPLPVKGNVPKLSWPCGITFDTKRNRVVMTSMGGVGYMYSFDVATSTWSYVAEMNNIDLLGLTYCADDDSLYGVEFERGQRGRLKIDQFDSDGNLKQSATLNEPVLISAGPDGGTQLAMVGKNLAILTPPFQTGGNGPRIAPVRCIVVDLKTAKVISSNVTAPRVAPAGDFDPKEVDRLWRLLGSADATEAEQAANRLIAGGDKAVEGLATRLEAPVASLSDERVKQLIDALGSADPDARERATTDLICAGETVEKPVRAALQGDLSPEAQSRLKLVLSDISEKQEGDTRPIAQLRRESASVRVLREIGTPAAIERLIELSADANANESTVAEQARAALRRI